MKKILLLGLFMCFSCSKDDNNCPNGRITSMTNNQDVYRIAVDNGNLFVVNKKTFDYYAINGSCYEGTK